LFDSIIFQVIGPSGVGKSHLTQALGYQAIRLGFTALYRSIFDLVRELLADENFAGQDRTLVKYLKPDLLNILSYRISLIFAP
jgi:DNA replication protein DnaC